MENKQTAVQWFANQLGITSGTMLEQAKQMEKKQIIEARRDGVSIGLKGYGSSNLDYYNETYGSKESDTPHVTPQVTSSQTEISDEEIEKEMLNRSGKWDDPLCFEIGWKDAIKWYREQLKQDNEPNSNKESH